jgi:hypothetical protein
MCTFTRTLIVLIVSMGVPLAGQFASAQPQNKKKPNQNPLASAANQAANDAHNADAKADSSKKAIAEANDAIRAAQKDVDDATKARTKIEEDTIDAQPADSELGKARDAYRGADKKYQEARKTASEDENYKSRKEQAKELEDSGEALRTLQKEFDEMPVIAESRAAMQSAKEVYDPLRLKLLEGTQDWVAANDDLKAKKKALDDAKHKYAEAAAAAKRAKLDAQKAEAQARAAALQAAAAQKTSQPPRRRGRY